MSFNNVKSDLKYPTLSTEEVEYIQKIFDNSLQKFPELLDSDNLPSTLEQQETRTEAFFDWINDTTRLIELSNDSVPSDIDECAVAVNNVCNINDSTIVGNNVTKAVASATKRDETTTGEESNQNEETAYHSDGGAYFHLINAMSLQMTRLQRIQHDIYEINDRLSSFCYHSSSLIRQHIEFVEKIEGKQNVTDDSFAKFDLGAFFTKGGNSGDLLRQIRRHGYYEIEPESVFQNDKSSYHMIKDVLDKDHIDYPHLNRKNIKIKLLRFDGSKWLADDSEITLKRTRVKLFIDTIVIRKVSNVNPTLVKDLIGIKMGSWCTEIIVQGTMIFENELMRLSKMKGLERFSFQNATVKKLEGGSLEYIEIMKHFPSIFKFLLEFKKCDELGATFIQKLADLPTFEHLGYFTLYNIQEDIGLKDIAKFITKNMIVYTSLQFCGSQKFLERMEMVASRTSNSIPIGCKLQIIKKLC